MTESNLQQSDSQRDDEIKRPRHLSGHKDLITSLLYLKKADLIISGANDAMIKIWSKKSENLVGTLYGHSAGVTALLDIDKPGLLVSGSKDKTIKIWNIRTRKCIRNLQGHSSIIFAVVYLSKEEKIASTARDKTIKIWDFYKGELLCTIEEPASMLCLLYIHSRNILIAGGFKGMIKIYSAKNYERMGDSLQGHSKDVFDLENLGKNLVASCSGDGMIMIWNINTGKCIRTLSNKKRSVMKIVKIPASNLLISINYNNNVYVWDFALGKVVANFLEVAFLKDSVYSMTYHHYSSLLFLDKAKEFHYVYFNDKIKIKNKEILIGNSVPLYENINYSKLPPDSHVC